ncbi:MAG: hypothetical protein GY793_03115 [Proteobacteria bacterium]|nr:hypothetical protein [Pseudomonadota bacterium]
MNLSFLSIRNFTETTSEEQVLLFITRASFIISVFMFLLFIPINWKDLFTSALNPKAITTLVMMLMFTIIGIDLFIPSIPSFLKRGKKNHNDLYYRMLIIFVCTCLMSMTIISFNLGPVILSVIKLKHALYIILSALLIIFLLLVTKYSNHQKAYGLILALITLVMISCIFTAVIIASVARFGENKLKLEHLIASNEGLDKSLKQTNQFIANSKKELFWLLLNEQIYWTSGAYYEETKGILTGNPSPGSISNRLEHFVLPLAKLAWTLDNEWYSGLEQSNHKLFSDIDAFKYELDKLDPSKLNHDQLNLLKEELSGLFERVNYFIDYSSSNGYHIAELFLDGLESYSKKKEKIQSLERIFKKNTLALFTTQRLERYSFYDTKSWELIFTYARDIKSIWLFCIFLFVVPFASVLWYFFCRNHLIFCQEQDPIIKTGASLITRKGNELASSTS